MAKNQLLEITPESLNLLTAMCHHGYFDGFYGKTAYFTNGFKGDRQYLFQSLGNMGATTTRSIDDVIDIILVGDNIMEDESQFHSDFAKEFNPLLNQKNSPYRRIRFISEEHLITRLEKRGRDDMAIMNFVKKYRESIKTRQLDLYDLIDSEKL